MTEAFNFEDTLKAIQSGQSITGKDSLLKLLYVGILKASEKWTMPISNWGQTLMQLSIYFPNRLDDYIKL